MSDGKSNKEVALNMAMAGMMPFLLGRLRDTEEYGAMARTIRELRVERKALRPKAEARIREITERAANEVREIGEEFIRRGAEIDAFVDDRIDALEELVAKFLTENNLEKVLEDISIPSDGVQASVGYSAAGARTDAAIAPRTWGAGATAREPGSQE
ncbi:hypothetical protein [Hyphomonas pacifica]|uniref:Uncharacterized protein n=1 Tax=Hyphomonas pacifica TaxID=1280941 RepID=A0A8B2PR37_9PROT|nr:hypothetical protein [Hyphomonas pacifica]RAN30619.1 hypothetical protein HY3_05575 [Hyphomonas pacifica]